jgi:hypothetical protein
MPPRITYPIIVAESPYATGSTLKPILRRAVNAVVTAGAGFLYDKAKEGATGYINDWMSGHISLF